MKVRLVMRITDKVKLAERELGRSVIAVNSNFQEELESKTEKPLTFGIKDTNTIPSYVIEKLRADERFVWLTIDKAANKGRAIDTDLLNPLTYRAMTGSSSGGPINILKGIIDFAIGTDGGGSVLAPALSCQLPSVIGAGLGLFVNNQKRSTEGIAFRGSVGFIGKSVAMLRMVMGAVIEEMPASSQLASIKAVIPEKGSVMCPDGEDMHDKVSAHLSNIGDSQYEITEMNMAGIEERKKGIQVIQEAFEKHDADLIITCEGPVDVYGYGETIPQHFGKPGLDITRNHGKFLVRAANMCGATAITVPVETLASGLVIIAKKGLSPYLMAMNLAEKLEEQIQKPEYWSRYFLEDSQFTGMGIPQSFKKKFHT
jgi:Amidase